MNTRTQFYLRTTIFFGLVAAVAVAAALALFLLVLKPKVEADAPSAPPYESLDFSPDEQQRVDEVYARFDVERADLLVEFDQLQDTLAILLQEEEAYSPHVAETVEQLHSVHAELQEISIRRFFAVLEVLPVEKREELRQLAADTLSQPE